MISFFFSLTFTSLFTGSAKYVDGKPELARIHSIRNIDLDETEDKEKPCVSGSHFHIYVDALSTYPTSRLGLVHNSSKQSKISGHSLEFDSTGLPTGFTGKTREYSQFAEILRRLAYGKVAPYISKLEFVKNIDILLVYLNCDKLKVDNLKPYSLLEEIRTYHLVSSISFPLQFKHSASNNDLYTEPVEDLRDTYRDAKIRRDPLRKLLVQHAKMGNIYEPESLVVREIPRHKGYFDIPNWEVYQRPGWVAEKILEGFKVIMDKNLDSERIMIVAILDSRINNKKRFSFYTNLAESRNGVDSDNNGYVDDVSGYNCVDNSGDVFTSDDSTHGTAMASITTAKHNVGTNNTVGIMPIMRNMYVAPLVVSSKSIGGIKGDTVAKCFGYAIQQKIPISINSYASFIPRSNRQAVRNELYNMSGLLYSLQKNKHILVASAGQEAQNINPDTGTHFVFPCSASVPSVVICVGGAQAYKTLYSSTTYGNKAVDLASYARSNFNSPGTSYSPPRVASMLALILKAYPDLTPQMVLTAIRIGIRKRTEVYWKQYFKYGMVSLYDGLRAAEVISNYKETTELALSLEKPSDIWNNLPEIDRGVAYVAITA